MIELIAIIAPLMTGYTIEPNSTQKVEIYITSMVGKRIDYDNSYGYQCVDWAQQFLKEIHNQNIRKIGTAWNWRKKGIGFSGWTRKYPGVNTPPPKAGDIIFLDISNHTKGHVGVVVSANSEYVRVSEQNGARGKAKGEGKDAINIYKRPYNVVLGWFTK